jgi:hypothetical protein
VAAGQRAPGGGIAPLRDVVPQGPGQAGVADCNRLVKNTLARATARRFPKANPAAPQAFAQALAPIAPRREPGRVTVYLDHGHLWPDVLPRRGWLVRGQLAWIDSASPPPRDKRLCSVAVVRP